eukprot:gene10166-21192_t
MIPYIIIIVVTAFSPSSKTLSNSYEFSPSLLRIKNVKFNNGHRNYHSTGLGSIKRKSESYSVLDDPEKEFEEKFKIKPVGATVKTDKIILPTVEEEKVPGSNNLSTWNARLLLLFVAALYGTNFGCVKILGEVLEPSVAAFLRFTVSSLVFAPWLLPNLFSKPKVVWGGFEVGFYSFIGYYAQSLALQTTPASTAAFICSLVVVVVPILDILFEKSTSTEKTPQMKLFTILPALLAASGVGFLELGGEAIPGIGDLLALGQPIFFGLAFWRTEKLTRNFPDPVDTRIFTGGVMMCVAICSLIWAYFDYIMPMLPEGKIYVIEAMYSHISALSDWKILAAIMWTGIVTTALTNYGENMAMVRLTAAESTVIYSTEPLWGTAFAALTLGEHIGWNTLIGAVLVLTACLWSSLGPAITTAGIISSFQAAVEMPEILANMELNWAELIKKLQDFEWFFEANN